MKEVNAAIITIGDELLIGQTVDTNSAFIAQQLNSIGIWVKRRIAIGDVRNDILRTLHEQAEDCSVLILTGGLGPTADDITKPALCSFFNSELIINTDVAQTVTEIFTRLGRVPGERNLKQAEVPAACKVLPNKRGTAPGMWFDASADFPAITISLPGVPHEMKGLMLDEVLPRLKQLHGLPSLQHRTLLTAGIGESLLADALTDFEASLPPHVKLAYLPAFGMVRLRITVRSDSEDRAIADAGQYFQVLKASVAAWMVADSDMPLPAALLEQFKARHKTFAVAESCTGGFISQLLTAIPGSSAVFNGGVVAYSNLAKENLLGVEEQLIAQHGAVSEEVVMAMVSGVRNSLSSDIAVATSGIMGPGGEVPGKPVGTVWMAVSDGTRTETKKLQLPYDRQRNIEMAAHAALTMVFRFTMQSNTP